MSDYLHNATKVARVRIREEDDDNFLLYHPVTDELHMVSRAGKDIFEMCDGRSIDDLVIDGAALLQADPASSENAEPLRADVLSFLCALQKRQLVELT